MATATKERRKGRDTGITLNREDLLGAIRGVAAAVSSRSPKPVLLNVLLHHGRLTATDQDIQVAWDIAWTDEPMLLPHSRLRSILEAAGGDDVTLTLDGPACIVQAGRGQWRLPVEDPKEFPTWQPEGLRPIARIPADHFCRAVKSVAYATDTESSRYALGAVLVEMKSGTVNFVGTDGRRLSAFSVDVDQATDDSTTLVPARAIQIVAAIAGHTEGAVQLETNGREIVATCDNAIITARLVEGKFPRWSDVFPDREAKSHVVDIHALLAATRAAAIVTTEESKGVDYTFTPEGLMLHGQSAASGESTVTCDLTECGTPCTTKLDPRFVVDFLKNLPSDEPHVEIEAVDGTTAVVLRAGDVRGVIMPLAKD